MLFNSLTYLLLFLPITVFVYFALNYRKLVSVSKAWLFLASLFFYGYWNPDYLPLILLSIVVNFGVGSILTKRGPSFVSRQYFLTLGILFNLGLLGHFKYWFFFAENINHVFSFDLSLNGLMLPLGISFFTFQQIAYLVDAYKTRLKEYGFLNYCVFVSFFPQLIAGPIVHHAEMMPQFSRLKNKFIDWENISKGLFIFFIGLFKKVVLADGISSWAVTGFANPENLNFFAAWATSLSYTFELYFDFSGYTDMAMGSAYLFNIKLPANFNSPYKALNIRDFWRRWHMTLGRFFADYVYIPLGGGKKGVSTTCRNLMVTFFLVGFWHGAGWTFLAWGFLHGVGMVIHRLWQFSAIKIPKFLAWFITFNFINVGWVIFRAESLHDAALILRGMIGLNGIAIPAFLNAFPSYTAEWGISVVRNPFYQVANGMGTVNFVVILLFSLVGCKYFMNSVELKNKLRVNFQSCAMFAIIFLYSFMALLTATETEFLYFKF